jgi:alpha-amylase/alpha-mannosidase (GH57 family)
MPSAGGDRFVCVHGHFYQPPRENPWLETVEVQDSAAPYHDWNERVTAECYAPNTAARILDDQGYITALRNNYSRISFNFGPTLLSWMEHARPDVYAQVVRADQDSCRRLGRGNALAQVYGHCIMPLASPRDQQTQVRWAIADFRHRFGRLPDGMWLPETAVDHRTLEVLARNGIRFTILAPAQAARVRPSGGAWTEVQQGGIDCSRPYRCIVAPGIEMILFFYDGDIAHAVAFGGLLNDGHNLSGRLTDASKACGAGSLVHIATDGESYGHHHRFGDMALAAAIEGIDTDGAVRLTNYAAYLDTVAVRDEVEIHENTSWSCAHGVERWRADCGCNSGAHPGWQQAWRAPLRQTLDWLKGQLDDIFERSGAKLLRDPWAARDAYVTVLLQRDDEHRQAFLERHALVRARSRERSRIWKLLEMQRDGMLSFTSCGWFFDECSGIETVQILTYAARALQLAGEFGINLEPELVHRLQAMRSNLPQYHDGRDIYRQLVRPQMTDASRMMAHYAMQSLFVPPAPQARVYAYRATALDRSVEHAGSAVFTVGQARLMAEPIEQSEDFVYAALHLGGHDMHCAVAPSSPKIDYPQLKKELLATFFAEPLTELVRRIDRAFGSAFYTLRDVLVAERRGILDQVMKQAMADCTADYQRMVTSNHRLLDFLAQAGVPLPDELRIAATFVVQRRLEAATEAFVAGADGTAKVIAAWDDAARWRIAPSTDGVRRLLERELTQAVSRIAAGVANGDTGDDIVRAHAIFDIAQSLALTLNTWETQGQYYTLIAGHHLQRWPGSVLVELRRLGERLRFHLREWDTLAERAA